MKLVKFVLSKKESANWFNVNLGPVTNGNQVRFLGLKYDQECGNWDLVTHQGFEQGEFTNVSYCRETFFAGSVNSCYPEFTSPTSTGLVLTKGSKQVVCFELNEKGEVESYGARFY